MALGAASRHQSLRRLQAELRPPRGAPANTTTLQDTYENWDYGYDGSGNPASSAVNLAGWVGDYDGANALTQQTRTGPIRVAGYTNEPTNVTVGGAGTRRWSLPGGSPWMFESFQDLSPNTSNISIVATDAVGNSTTQVWKIDANSTVSNFTYDDDGAMLTRVNNADSTTVDMSSNYTWDSLGRLLSYQQGNTTVSFTYDWQGRRVSLSANVSGNVTTQNFLWDGNQIFERRDGGTGSGNISRKYFGDGVVTVSGNTSTNYFYTKDHLGSIREIVANDGHTVDGRYDYGPWGETNYFDYSGGSAPQPDFGYAGYMQTSFVPGYYFTENRVYDPSTHHWLSRDPIGEAGGLNLYGYAGDDPIDGIDPSGLAKITTNADGSSTVQVSQCEIVILDGHGDNARPHTFQFPAKGCAAGGFIGCGAGGTNSRIPKDNLIPGSPYWSGEVMQDDSFTDALKAMNSGAKSLAKTMCAKCKCKTVTIYHMYAPSGNKLIDFFTSPSNTKDVIDCKKQ